MANRSWGHSLGTRIDVCEKGWKTERTTMANILTRPINGRCNQKCWRRADNINVKEILVHIGSCYSAPWRCHNSTTMGQKYKETRANIQTADHVTEDIKNQTNCYRTCP
eukprot:7669824-Pyramimonas_sp.AAC.1